MSPLSPEEFEFLSRNQDKSDTGKALKTPACGWFVSDADFDGLVSLYGPYWQAEKAWEKHQELEAFAAMVGYAPRLTILPVEGIKPA